MQASEKIYRKSKLVLACAVLLSILLITADFESWNQGKIEQSAITLGMMLVFAFVQLYFVRTSNKINYRNSLILAFLINFVILVFIGFLLQYVHNERLTWTIALQLLIRFVIVNSILAVVARLYDTITRTKRLLQTLNRSRSEEVEIKLRQLKQQLNPHFLFNALNVLKSLITIDPQKAINYTIDLADLLRITVNEEKKEVSLEEELELCSLFLNIQNMRFNENILFENAVPHEFIQQKIPFLSLLLLIENAIKHNKINRTNKLFIQLFVEEDMLVIKNNLSMKETAESSSGIGLKNIEKRFQLLYNRAIIVDQNQVSFWVKLPLQA